MIYNVIYYGFQERVNLCLKDPTFKLTKYETHYQKHYSLFQGIDKHRTKQSNRKKVTILNVIKICNAYTIFLLTSLHQYV